jgi:hypothetical protein
VIIDNISWLLRSGTPTEIRRLLKTFRRYVNETGNSMLLLHNSEMTARRVRSPHVSKGHVTSIQPENTALAEFADSVFALCPSTFSPNHRYLKLVSRSGELPLALANGSQLQTMSSPPYQGGLDAAAADGVVLSTATSLVDPVHVYQLQRSISPSSINHSPLTTNHLRGAFPGFQFIGLSSEADHTRDYAAEIAKFEATVLRAVEKEERRRKLSAKESLAQGIIDGSYARYMLNE